MNHDERYKKLKENCRPIKLTRSISFTTISPAGENMMGLGLDGISKGYILVFIGPFLFLPDTVFPVDMVGVFVISVRRSYSHPDLLLIHPS